jgi:hypothetical protein
MPLKLESDGAVTLASPNPLRTDQDKEVLVSDLVYLAVGVGVLALFAGYAVLLRRA